MIFKNIDANPAANYLSVDDLYELNFNAPVQGAISDTDAAVLLSEEGGAWEASPGIHAHLPTRLSRTASPKRIGYIEGWVGAPRSISGTNAARETFTVSGADVIVSSVAVRVARVNGNDPLDVHSP